VLVMYATTLGGPEHYPDRFLALSGNAETKHERPWEIGTDRSR